MQPKKNSPDFVLFITVLTLLAVGVVMVFSASEYSTLVYYGDSFHYFKLQLGWSILGLLTMFFISNIEYRRLKQYIWPILALAFVVLVAVLIPGVGQERLGARRWIALGPIGFAPAEMVKLCLIIFTAYGLSRQKEKVKYFSKGVLPYMMVMGLAAAGAVAVTFAIALKPYRLKRFLAFLDPWADPLGAGFHIIQGLYAIGSGGFFGLGLGQSRQKFLYLPENHTDFIFAIIAEELGFFGASLVVILFLLFIWRGLKIAITSHDPFASLLATGITAWVGVQAIINIGVVTGSLPVTGIPLPFISYGGTSLVFTMAAVGLLLNISKYSTPR